MKVILSLLTECKLTLYYSYQYTKNQAPRRILKPDSIFSTFDEMQVLYKKKQILNFKRSNRIILASNLLLSPFKLFWLGYGSECVFVGVFEYATCYELDALDESSEMVK